MSGHRIQLVPANCRWVRGTCYECFFFDQENHFTPYALQDTNQCLACEAVRRKCIDESRKQKMILVWKAKRESKE